MILPTEEEIITGFRRWITDYRDSKPSSKLWKEYASRCKELGKKPGISASAFRDFFPARGGSQGTTGRKPPKLLYNHIFVIAEIIGVPCLQIFFEYCRTPSLDDVIYEQKDAWCKDVPSDEDGADGCEVYFLQKSIKESCPVRVDHVQIKAGGSTGWGPHDGYEFIYVSEAKLLRFTIGESEDESLAKTYDVTDGEAIAFPSSLWHRIENLGGSQASLAVGRLAMSAPIKV